MATTTCCAPPAAAASARACPPRSPPAKRSPTATAGSSTAATTTGSASRADALPPSNAFWSISAYSAESRRLLDTHTGRYSIGSQAPDLPREPSGALEIFVSSAAPEDPARRANWLPVRAGPLLLVARIYQPLPAVLEGRYSMPPVVSADD
jgi:hypothetical protein